MRTITIGRSNKCDIIIPDDSVSRIHAEISRNGNEFIYRDMGKNGTNIGGRMIHNERIAIAPGTPVFLANRVPLPWVQVYAMLPGYGNVPSEQYTHADVWSESTTVKDDQLGIGWGILSFLFPIIGFILYFVWKDSYRYKAKQAANIAWVSIAISFVIGFISGLSM